MLTIPEEKKAAFLADARKVAEQGGLFSVNRLSVFDRKISLLHFPDFSDSELKHLDFTYSYFEKEGWENAGIGRENCSVYSGKIGWRGFNKAVQALYILAELYSDTLYASRNDSLNIPTETIKWLRYVLKRELHFTWRNHIWELMEIEARKSMRYGNEPYVDPDFIEDFRSDEPDTMELMTVAFLNELSVFINPQTRKEAFPGEKDKITFLQAMIRMYDEVVTFKETSTLPMEEQLEFLFAAQRQLDGRKEEDLRFMREHTGLALGMIMLPPQWRVRIISEIYGKDFWSLWWERKDRIPYRKVLPENDGEDSTGELTERSTADFFGIQDEDRLYWWRTEGDVGLSDEIRTWLQTRKERLDELCLTEPDESIEDWQRRLVTVLHSNQWVTCFEELFFELMGHFHEAKYRAAVMLMEEEAKAHGMLGRLIAVLANRELRMVFFLF